MSFSPIRSPASEGLMQSPFEKMLGTNAILSDSECSSVRSSLEEPLKDLANVTEEISRLQSMIDDAVNRREKLQHFIDAHLALLSPARRLPEDIVRNVFTATLPSTRNATISSEEAPLLLCRVCKSWQAIALSTPQLWASFHIVVPPPSKFERLVTLVKIWLKRSGSVPLDISMVYSMASDWNWDVSPLLETFASVSHRWKNVQLTLPNTAAHALGRLTSDDVPQLRSIALCPPSPGQDDRNILGSWPFDFLETKSLRRVTFTGTCSFASSAISWGTLTHLDMCDFWPTAPVVPFSLALAILAQCTALQTCKIALEKAVEEKSAIIRPFILPQLSRLAVLCTTDNVGPRFFSHISLPELRSFYLETGHNVDLTRLVPSPTSMKYLRLEVEGLGCENLLASLADMPLLEKLVLFAEPRSKEQTEETNTWRYWKSREGDQDFLARLTPLTNGHDSALCPLLRHVELHLCLVSDESLLQFIRSRTHLVSVTATFYRPMQFDIIPHLQDAISGGLAVALSYESGDSEAPTYSPQEGSTDPAQYMLPPRPMMGNSGSSNDPEFD
ncbi:F-box domain-containing protein [Mycena sanguinolenta]|uniref:F-box domain-containing protein n=1 Tax=Mycena sanguinolenta TaxID=230812 RepID=A0A8H6XQ84_9AGAR|nr:F-box domain-containing protein [Mycena sanguinolenta]